MKQFTLTMAHWLGAETRETESVEATKEKEMAYMNLYTGEVGKYDDWYYTDEYGCEVNAVDLGEVIEVRLTSRGDWVEA